MKKKIVAILFVLISFFSLNSVNAESLSNYIDLQSYSNVYRLSEESDVSLPFVKLFNEKVIFDKGMDKSGLSIASKTLEIDEKLSGIQTIISADTVNIKGSLEYGIIIASNVVISGTIEKDIFIVAESLFITETANIGNDIVAVAETMEVKGNVSGNLIVNSANLLMQGNVSRDFRAYSEVIEFNDANIQGNIYIETNSEIDISEKYPDAIIKKIPTTTITEEEKKADTMDTILDCVIGIILFVLLNLLITLLKPNVFKVLSNKVVKYSTYAIIAGVLGIVTIPIVVTLLIILSAFGMSVITMPILIVYIALLVVTISLAKFITGSVIYEALKDKLKIDTKLKSVGTLLLIYTALYLVCNMPYIGWFATMASVLLSSGIIITGLTKKVD